MDQKKKEKETKKMNPHVLMFPLPLQGPINCYLKLAELLSDAAIAVTFLNTKHMHHRLLRHTDVQSRFSRYPNFQFLTLPDGLPDHHKRCGELTDELTLAIEAVTQPLLRNHLADHGGGGQRSKVAAPVTCLIVDGIFSWATDMAADTGIPLIYFDTISPCATLIYMCLQKLIDAGEFPFKGNDLDERITSIPGMESFLRRRDLPDFCRSSYLSTIQPFMKAGQQIPQAQALIMNTFEDLDAEVLSEIHSLCPNLYAIGPLHALYKRRIEVEPTHTNSLWKEDKSCLSWLNAQPLKSVIYVSIGSHASMTKAESLELWHGLVNSGLRFLWVKRPGSITGQQTESDTDTDIDNDHVPVELLEGTKERGFIVEWAPQEEVLAHPAIGGFFTHSGWNSTLESIIEGVPMICWPSFVDEQPISRFVSEVWNIGMDMKDTCDRVTIENMVKNVMQSRRDEFTQRACELARLAHKSINEGGKSSNDIDRLITDIRLLS